MDIAIRKYQQIHIIDVKGDLDLYNAFHLKEAVQKLVDMGARLFIVNMKGVNYVDSSGIGALLSINRLLAKDGRRLCIASITQTVQNLMNITRLAGFLPISKTVVSAIETIEVVANASDRQPAV
jgi:anti-sigma B factor antagonist